MNAHGVTPILSVSDMAASFAWFEKLGWHKHWDWGDPPDFGAVGSGHCEIFLSIDPQRTLGPDSGVWLAIWVDDVDEVYRVCLEEDIEIIWPPRDEPWGVRELGIRHPDGHVFRVSRGTEPSDSE